MDLFLTICEAVGLGLATGIGGPLAWLFIAVMASLEAGIDPRGTDWEFIGSGWFVAVLFAANVAAFYGRRRETSLRVPHAAAAAVLGAIFGAAAFAVDAEPSAVGFVLGAAVAGGSSLAAFDVLEGARRRARAGGDDGAAGATLGLIFGLLGVLTGALALFVAPAALLALVGLAVLASGRRRKAGEKYEGLRVLR